MPVLIAVACYLIGSIPFAYLLTLLITGEDVRTLGNRNAGAANVYRAVSKAAGAAVSISDIGKGAVAVLFMRAMHPGGWWPLAGGVAAVLGHNFPVWLAFRGGRGLAASIGALLALMPVETAIVLPVLGLIFLVLTGSAITGAIVSFLLLIGLATWRNRTLPYILAPLVFLLAMAVRWIPQEVRAVRQAEDMGELLRSHLLDQRYEEGGRPSEEAAARPVGKDSAD
ncbi:MAG: glycerol-3-phosphate acyltransferase [Chloroflexota bacterium]|nr:glycerol-3-phosphate acyltransferase [Chloroflexota bacterium]